jgi:glycosyltransferase involved in cell wall biosynthesis
VEKLDNLTVLITTFNEEANIRECLESASFAKKIFVVDSFSTDRTTEIAREYTDWVVTHEYVTPAIQKNWALPHVDTEWVFILDADERISPELARRIREVLAAPTHDGYDIRRRSYFFGRLINHCGWNRDRVLRLFRTKKGRYPDVHVHEAIQLDGTIARIDEPLYHHTYHSLEQYFGKFERYTTWAALDLSAKGGRASWWKLFFKPLARFLRQYVFQAGFLDGREGLVLCRLSAMSVFTKYAKLWELQRGKADGSADKNEE